jgi:hypothetical protein
MKTLFAASDGGLAMNHRAVETRAEGVGNSEKRKTRHIYHRPER